MSDATRTRRTVLRNHDPGWWRNPELRTFKDMIEAGMHNAGLTPTMNRLSDLSAELEEERGGERIHRSTFDNLRSGRRGKKPRERTLQFLSDALGGPLWRWQQIETRPKAEVLTWTPPREGRSPFLTSKTQSVYSDMLRAIHQQSVDAYIAGDLDGQRRLIKNLAAKGWNVEGMEDHVVELNPAVVGEIGEESAPRDDSLRSPGNLED